MVISLTMSLTICFLPSNHVEPWAEVFSSLSSCPAFTTLSLTYFKIDWIDFIKSAETVSSACECYFTLETHGVDFELYFSHCLRFCKENKTLTNYYMWILMSGTYNMKYVFFINCLNLALFWEVISSIMVFFWFIEYINNYAFFFQYNDL